MPGWQKPAPDRLTQFARRLNGMGKRGGSRAEGQREEASLALLLLLLLR